MVVVTVVVTTLFYQEKTYYVCAVVAVSIVVAAFVAADLLPDTYACCRCQCFYHKNHTAVISKSLLLLFVLLFITILPAIFVCFNN